MESFGYVSCDHGTEKNYEVIDRMRIIAWYGIDQGVTNRKREMEGWEGILDDERRPPRKLINLAYPT